MSDTPETDARVELRNPVGMAGNTALIDTDFARKLERERDEARKKVEQLKYERENWRLSSVCRELKAEVERLKWRLNHCAENIGDLVAIKFATGASDAEIDSAMKGDK